MDVVTALVAAPQVTPPQTPSAQTPADHPQPAEGAASGDAFEEEFSNAASTEEASTDDAAETTGDEALGGSNELILDIEDLTATGEAAETVEETPLEAEADIAATNPSAELAVDTDVVATETPVDPEVDAGEPVDIVDVAPTQTETEESLVAEDAPTDIEPTDIIPVEAQADEAHADADTVVVQPSMPQTIAVPVAEPASVATVIETLAPAPIEASAEAEAEPLREVFERPMTRHAEAWSDGRRGAYREFPAELVAISRPSVMEQAQASALPKLESAAVQAAQSTGATQQVVAAIRSEAGADQIDVQLDPPELGRVRIQLNFERADTVVATVSSERGETLDLLRRHGADLTRELERAGFANVELEFSSSDSASSNGGQQDASSFDSSEADLMSEEAVMAYVRQVTGRLDRFV